MKMKRAWLVTFTLTVLLASIATPIMAPAASATEDNSDNMRIVSEGEHWLKLESPIITALFPREGEKPMFIWWYTNAPDQVYVVKFKGLIEWFAFDNPNLPANPEYYNSLRNASAETWGGRFDNWYFKPEEENYLWNLWRGDPTGEHRTVANRMEMLAMMRNILLQMISQMNLTWHMPLFPFDEARWELIQPANINTSDGRIIGVAFGFKLVDTELPRFQFAKGKIMIRVRFYNTTVEETVPGTNSKYTVNAGEMKMDLVINKWVWNFDTIKSFITQLENFGFNINIPDAKSRLALWINLASINVTRVPLTQAEEQPESIEEHSTPTVMDIENHMESMTTISAQEMPIVTSHPIVRLQFINETEKLAGFFRFVASAKVTDYPNEGDVNMVPVKAAFRAAGAFMRLFIGYPYFGNGTLEHDPSIGVNTAGLDTTTPVYSVQAPSGTQIVPTSIRAYVPPLFTTTLMIALIVVVSAAAVTLYLVKWRRKTPVNMVGASTAPVKTTG